ncbi:NUDIX domain-containing protein [Alcaligenaceae bacterium B3P038]|nr:NUDIX domain-containing protein [Alcaligenaceae bacterium B3P038]
MTPHSADLPESPAVPSPAGDFSWPAASAAGHVSGGAPASEAADVLTQTSENAVVNTPAIAVHTPAIYIGRFQPPTQADFAALRRMAARGAGGIVVLAGSHQAPSPRQPFDWPTVAALLAQGLTTEEQAALSVLPLRDEDTDSLWRAALQRTLADLDLWHDDSRPVLTTASEIATLHDIGKLAVALHADLVPVATDSVATEGASNATGVAIDVASEASTQAAAEPLTEAALRDLLFDADPQEGTAPATLPDAVAAAVPAPLHVQLTHWMQTPAFAAIAEEWRVLRGYREAWSVAPYPPIFVTVDTVVHCAGRVLLVERGQHPGKGLYAVPGGFLEPSETVFEAAVRELCEETGLTLDMDAVDAIYRGVAVFDRPDRSQRGRTVTHAHYFDLGDGPLPQVEGADDALAAHWTPIADLAGHADRFLDDHYLILEHFLALPRPAPVWAPLAVFG